MKRIQQCPSSRPSEVRRGKDRARGTERGGERDRQRQGEREGKRERQGKRERDIKRDGKREGARARARQRERDLFRIRDEGEAAVPLEEQLLDHRVAPEALIRRPLVWASGLGILALTGYEPFALHAPIQWAI